MEKFDFEKWLEKANWVVINANRKIIFKYIDECLNELRHEILKSRNEEFCELKNDFCLNNDVELNAAGNCICEHWKKK